LYLIVSFSLPASCLIITHTGIVSYRDLDPEDEEEAYERRKLERKIREKEAAYQEVSS